LLFIDAFPVVSKPLTGELSGRQGQEAVQSGFLVPIRDLGFATRGDAAVEGCDQRSGGSDRRRVLGTPFGHVPISGGEGLDGLSHIPHGCGGAEFIDGDPERFGTHRAIEDALRRAEVGGRNNLGLDALPFA